MIILGKADNILYSLSTQEMKDFSDMLRSIGCVPYNEAHPSLINNDLEYVGQQMDAKDSIDFPLSAFTQLIDSEPSSFTYGASKLLEGDFEYSWLGTWLKAQGITDPNKHYEEILDSKTPSLGE